MIQLFVSDIDGCLSEPYQPMNLPLLADIAQLVAEGGQLGSHPVIPAFSLCSGRPMTYVECITQLLGVQMPVLFESGGGMFDPVKAQVTWHPNLTPEVKEQVREVTLWLEKDCVPGTSLVLDYAKRAHAGVIAPDPEEILRTVPIVSQFVETSGLAFDVFPTHLSIDVIPRGISKENGMQWLASALSLDLGKIAYIGDSLGDLQALRIVGASFAPENAKNVVNEEVSLVTSTHTQGVLDAMLHCQARNQQTIEIEELSKR